MAPPVVIPRSRGHLIVSGCGGLLAFGMLCIIFLAILEGEEPLGTWLCMATVAGGIGLLSAWIGSQAVTRVEVYGSRLELTFTGDRSMRIELSELRDILQQSYALSAE